MPKRDQFYVSHSELERLRRINQSLRQLNLQVSSLLRRLPTLRTRKQCVDAAELLRALALQLTSLQQQRHEILLSAIEPSFSLFVCHFGRVCDDCKGLPIQDAQRDYEVLESREVCPDTGNELNALLDLAELIAELTMSRSSRDNVTKTVVIRAISSSQKALLRQKADLRRWIVDPEPEFKVIDSGYQCGRCEKPME